MANTALWINLLLISARINQMFLLSTNVDENFQNPKGSLPCQLIYTTRRLNCCCRGLKTIPKLPVNITSVNLSENKLVYISDTAFRAQGVLLSVNLKYNMLRVIHKTPFKDLVELQRLDLSESRLKRLESTSFVGLHNLVELFMVRNQLKSLPDGIFKDLTNLRTLDLSYNLLLEIPGQALTPLTALQNVSFSGNMFETFAFGEGFKNLTKLSTLTVHSLRYADERHTHLDNSTFQNLVQVPLKNLAIFFTYNFSVTTADDLFTPFLNLTLISTGYQWRNAFSSVRSKLHFVEIFLEPYNFRLTNKALRFLSPFYTSIVVLDLGYSDIKGIYGPAFAMFSNLRILKVSRVLAMQFISSDAFDGLQNLEELYLAYNQINKLPVKSFKAFRSGRLKLLDLSYNSFTVFTDDNAFSSLANLTHLNLSNNPIYAIGNWIHGLTNLQELKLDSITTPYFIELYIWTKPLPFLRYLDFSSPHITDLFLYEETFCLSKMVPKLETLSFAFALLTNSISLINNFSFLKYLDVSGSFYYFKEFEQIWGNNTRLPQLQVLKLSDNQIMSIDNMNFETTAPNLIDLDLSNNLIQSFPERSLHILQNMQYLKLTGNRIFSVYGLFDLPVIKYLDLSRNLISEFPLSFFEKLNDSLEILDASGNPFSCTCAIEPFQKWFQANKNVTLVPGSQYKCKTPDSFVGDSIMEVQLDCESHMVFDIATSIACGMLTLICVILVVKYRWRIRYRLFLLFTWQRKYQTPSSEDEVLLNSDRFDAFISYAHENERDLSWVVNDLRKNIEDGPEPFRLCIGHARDFIPGAPLLEAITEAIHNSRKTIVVLSPSYLDSEWCYFETQHAWLRLLNEGKDVIILVLLDPIPNAKMTMWLRQFLCKKGYLTWPSDKAAQELFFRCLRRLIKKRTAVDRRYDV